MAIPSLLCLHSFCLMTSPLMTTPLMTTTLIQQPRVLVQGCLRGLLLLLRALWAHACVWGKQRRGGMLHMLLLVLVLLLGWD